MRSIGLHRLIQGVLPYLVSGSGKPLSKANRSFVTVGVLVIAAVFGWMIAIIQTGWTDAWWWFEWEQFKFVMLPFFIVGGALIAWGLPGTFVRAKLGIPTGSDVMWVAERLGCRRRQMGLAQGMRTRLLRIALLCGLCLTPISIAFAADWTTYVNPRFGTIADVSVQSFIANSAPENPVIKASKRRRSPRKSTAVSV